MIEEWKPLIGFIDVEVSSLGFIRKISTKKPIALILTEDNNYRFSARLSSKSYTTRKIHVMVYELFSGEKLKSCQWVRHKDSDSKNNSFDNLVCEYRYNTNPNTKCEVCGADIYIQARFIKKTKTNKFCCSYLCRAELLKTEYTGDKNPNFRNIGKDSDGYILVNSPKGKMKMHKASICEAIGIDNIPKMSELVHIHHRDCDKENNHIDNLVMLSVGDHKWLHKNFGNAGLWAMMNNKVSIDQLVEWSRNKGKAEYLLSLNARYQCLEIRNLICGGETIENSFMKVVLKK